MNALKIPIAVIRHVQTRLEATPAHVVPVIA